MSRTAGMGSQSVATGIKFVPQGTMQEGQEVGLPASELNTVVKVLGLPFEANQQHVFEFFSGLSVRPNGVQIFSPCEGDLHALVAFETAEDANRARALHRQAFNSKLFGKRYVYVVRFQPKDLRIEMSYLRLLGLSSSSPVEAAEMLKGGSDMEFTCIKITNLPYSATKSSILKFMSDFSVVEGSAHVMLFPNGKATGEGYVETTSVEEAQRAVQSLNQTKFKATYGERIVDAVQVTRKEMRGARALMANLDCASTSTSGADCRGYVKVKGVPFQATTADIKNFFHDFALVEEDVCIVLREDNRPSGRAFVQFESVQEARRATEKNNTVFSHAHGERGVNILQVTREEIERTLASAGGGAVQPGVEKNQQQQPTFTLQSTVQQPTFMQQQNMQQSTVQQPTFMLQQNMHQSTVQQPTFTQQNMQQSTVQQPTFKQQQNMHQSTVQQPTFTQQQNMQQSTVQQPIFTQQQNMQQSTVQQPTFTQQQNMQQSTVQQPTFKQQQNMQQSTMQQPTFMHQQNMQQPTMQAQTLMQQQNIQPSTMQVQTMMQQHNILQEAMQDQTLMPQQVMLQSTMQQPTFMQQQNMLQVAMKDQTQQQATIQYEDSIHQQDMQDPTIQYGDSIHQDSMQEPTMQYHNSIQQNNMPERSMHQHTLMQQGNMQYQNLMSQQKMQAQNMLQQNVQQYTMPQLSMEDQSEMSQRSMQQQHVPQPNMQEHSIQYQNLISQQGMQQQNLPQRIIQHDMQQYNTQHQNLLQHPTMQYHKHMQEPNMMQSTLQQAFVPHQMVPTQQDQVHLQLPMASHLHVAGMS